ncbi:uncharacterized protein JCM10292_007582 [Rhodotorula paludigena]|uniref:uncharacterized protein n=1 Tax=Rhodotorula paludigena TaxID=86838 RepID=UPI00317260A7
MDGGGASGMSGLGISFDTWVPPSVPPQQATYAAHGARLAPHLHHRPLHHSVSYDDGLYHRQYSQPMSRQPSELSDGSSKQVRIAAGGPEVLNGKGGYLPYDHHHLSPLSEFEQSPASATGSSQPFSPASLSSLPSSVDVGTHPTFRPEAIPSEWYPIRNDPLHSAQAHPSSSRASRLPPFLQERQRSGGLVRPKSMMELGQISTASAATTAPYDEHIEHATFDVSPLPHEIPEEYGQGSPDSMPSSAGALQRQQFEQQPEAHARHQQRLRASEGRPRRLAEPAMARPLARMRSRSLSAREMKELAERESARASEADTAAEEELDAQDDYDGGDASEAEAEDEVGTVISVAPPAPGPGAATLQRQSTLLTAGASTVRRRKELDRLLAPTSRYSTLPSLSAVAHSPTPSTSSSAITHSTHQRTSSHASTQATSIPSPVVLEQAKSGQQPRVELDLMLETPLVVEGGMLKGRLEVRVRKPKEREGEVWLGAPKIRVIGFEELSSGEGRYIFYHASAPANDSKGPLSFHDSDADEEGYHRAKAGPHSVAVRMRLPIGKGAKGPWKGKQGVVRYIAIASVKLKAQDGGNRSIAHFYRHLDVFPYLNPAFVLAPAVKPLLSEAAKSLFMGGNGKVTLSASLHRETWVAGQRCYVEVHVANESSKKIKTLTLALIRTTSVYRASARPPAHAARDPYGFGVQGVPAPDSDTAQTQTTRKKVAETTLELGKKGTKGVTAKGSWIGVEAGESADFSPSFLVPADALTISRGRHLEVSYSVKISVGGSLSADISTDIPIHIVNFVSLDPPPGHIGPSPIPAQTRRPVARSWSSNQLRDAVRPSHGPTRMTSIDSLRLDDLNLGPPTRSTRPPLSRIASLESIRTADLPRGDFVPSANAPIHNGDATIGHRASDGRNQVLVDRARDRQLQHQMSLQCISSAIASATARRGGMDHQSSITTLRTELSREGLSQDLLITEEAAPAQHAEMYAGQNQHFYALPELDLQAGNFVVDGMGIQLDDLDEVPDDPAFLDRQIDLARAAPSRPDGATLPSIDSDDELDSIMRSHFSDDEDDMPHRQTTRASPPPRSNPSHTVRASPVMPLRVASPTKVSATAHERPAVDRSPVRRSSDAFAFATPTSPVKAHVELPQIDEAGGNLGPTRFARPLPTPPPIRPTASSPTKPSSSSVDGTSVPGTLKKTPSGASLRRNPVIIRKAASTRSIRSTASSVDQAGPGAPHADALARTLSSARSPSIASPRVSPILASGTTVKSRPPTSPATAVPSSPARKVIKAPSPALRATRSMAELRSTAPPVSPRKSAVLPSVKNKFAALETRQATLTRLATTTRESGTGRARVSNVQLARADSVMSSASSVAPSEFNLNRANSMASFKAPLLKRGAGIMDEVPPVPPLPHA